MKTYKNISEIYEEYFFKKYKLKGYKFKNSIFSNDEILDCLERELDSYSHLSTFLKKTVKFLPKKILILGPGSGKCGSTLRSMYPSSYIFELDINSFVINRLQNKHQNDSLRIPLIGNAKKIPFPDNSIDLIIGYSVLRYIDNHEKVLVEVSRILKHSGLLLFAEGKNKHTIKKFSEEFNKKRKKYSLHELSEIKLPNLNFFYFLLDNFAKNKTIQSEISEYMHGEKISLIQAAYIKAGTCSDSIYLLEAKK